MTIYLSALGWIGDKPAGNRLRWHFPLQETDGGGKYRGMPTAVVIERAPLLLRMAASARESSPYPAGWWDSLGDQTIGGMTLTGEYKLPGPVQAVAFVWRGGTARIELRSGQAGAVEQSRMVANGDTVYAECTAVDAIAAIGSAGTLEQLRALDLFRDRQLDWKPIAEVAAEPGFGADLSTVAKRYGEPTTLTDDQWKELVRTERKAAASVPADAVPGEPTDWELFEVMLGLRWEIALLGGFAWYDGPGATGCELDKLLDRPLDEPSGGGNGLYAYAYRVRDMDSKEPSNIAVVLQTEAPPLGVPGIPQLIGPEVRLPERPTPQAGPFPAGLPVSLHAFTPLPFPDEKYRVQLTYSVMQTDYRAHGAEIDEGVTSSPTTGSAEERRSFMLRSRNPGDPPLLFASARSFDVDFPDVRVLARARAIDAWDRVSGYSLWTSATSLTLRHEPLPPPLETVSHASGTAGIIRRTGVAGEPDWQPDPLVRRTGGRLNLYRQTAAPRTADAAFGAAVPAGGGLYRSAVTGVAALADFIGGSLSVGGVTETVLAVSGSEALFRLSDGAGSAASVFGPGNGRLIQDMKHPSLWVQVADFPAESLPDTLIFADPLPAPSAATAVSYAGRLSYFGRLGPLGGIVRGLRQPVVPAVPPPFMVEPLGIDFFHRTLLQLTFTTPAASGVYTVWWCDGEANAEELVKRGSPGTHQAQPAQGGLYLYETLPLPIPQYADRAITLGVQQVGDGANSDFAVVVYALPALQG